MLQLQALAIITPLKLCTFYSSVVINKDHARILVEAMILRGTGGQIRGPALIQHHYIDF